VTGEEVVAPFDLGVGAAIHVEDGEAQSVDAGVTTMRGLRMLRPVAQPVVQDVRSESGCRRLVHGAKVGAEGFHEVGPR
jgi:hypothetical protein